MAATTPTDEKPHLKKFFPYLDLLNSESDRGKVLISTGFIEQQLKEVLQAFMQNVPQVDELFEGGNAALGSLSSRITACFALGLISKIEHDDLQLIRKIRNDFAHDIHTSFDTPSVIDRCSALRASAPNYSNLKSAEEVTVNSQGQFTTAAVALILRLTNRPHYVTKQRCAPANWPY